MRVKGQQHTFTQNYLCEHIVFLGSKYKILVLCISTLDRYLMDSCRPILPSSPPSPLHPELFCKCGIRTHPTFLLLRPTRPSLEMSTYFPVTFPPGPLGINICHDTSKSHLGVTLNTVEIGGAAALGGCRVGDMVVSVGGVSCGPHTAYATVQSVTGLLKTSARPVVIEFRRSPSGAKKNGNAENKKQEQNPDHANAVAVRFSSGTKLGVGVSHDDKRKDLGVWVNRVDSGSPADLSGVCIGDSHGRGHKW